MDTSRSKRSTGLQSARRAQTARRRRRSGAGTPCASVSALLLAPGPRATRKKPDVDEAARVLAPGGMCLGAARSTPAAGGQGARPEADADAGGWPSCVSLGRAAQVQDMRYGPIRSRGVGGIANKTLTVGRGARISRCQVALAAGGRNHRRIESCARRCSARAPLRPAAVERSWPERLDSPTLVGRLSPGERKEGRGGPAILDRPRAPDGAAARHQGDAASRRRCG